MKTMKKTFKKLTQKGMTMPMVIVLLLVIMPIALAMYHSVSSVSKASTSSLKKRTAANYASDAILDYMRQFSNFTVGSYFDPLELNRAISSKDHGEIEFEFDLSNADQKTILLRGQGRFGLDPNNPEAQQTVEALIYFHPGAVTVGSDMRSVGRYRMEQNDAVYNGSFLFEDATMAGDNLTFNIGPVYVEGNLEVNASFLPRFNCDLYVGGNLNQTPNMGPGANVYRYVPDLPRPRFTTEAYRNIADFYYTDHKAIKFNEDDTFQVTEGFNTQIGGSNAPYRNGQGYVLSPAIPLPDDAVFFTEGANIGFWGTVSKRVMVVAAGSPNNPREGNAYYVDDLNYKASPGVTTPLSSREASFAVIAANKIIFYPKSDTDLSVTGAIYSIDSPHIPVIGPSNQTLTFTGTRNGRFIMQGNSFNAGITQDYDPGLNYHASKWLPGRAMMVNLTVLRNAN